MTSFIVTTEFGEEHVIPAWGCKEVKAQNGDCRTILHDTDGLVVAWFWTDRVIGIIKQEHGDEPDGQEVELTAPKKPDWLLRVLSTAS